MKRVLRIVSLFFIYLIGIHLTYAQNVIEENTGSLSNMDGSRVIEKVGIAVVAPSGFAQQSDSCGRGIEFLERHGFNVTNYYDSNLHQQRFAGSDDVRIMQMKKAYQNPDAKMVMAIRGGYGASRLLPALDFKKMAGSGKVFVGYSDTTVIQMGLLKYGAVSFAGPMVCSDFGQEEPSDYTFENFEKILTSKSINIQWQEENNPTVDASGIFWGGNLTMISHLAGTKWMPDIKGGILFLEDISEHPFRVERMLIQLDEAGILKKQKAVVLGRFTGYRLSDVDNGYDFETMLSWIRKRVSVPVITGLPFGHTKDKVTLPVGAVAHLKSDETGVSLVLSGYPVIK